MYDGYKQKPIFYIHVTPVQRPVKLYKTTRLSACLYCIYHHGTLKCVFYYDSVNR